MCLLLVGNQIKYGSRLYGYYAKRGILVLQDQQQFFSIRLKRDEKISTHSKSILSACNNMIKRSSLFIIFDCNDGHFNQIRCYYQGRRRYYYYLYT